MTSAHEMDFKEQKENKPPIEDFCEYFLTDTTLKEGMAWLLELSRELKMKPCWYAFNSYKCSYKGKGVVYYTVGGRVQIKTTQKNWLHIRVYLADSCDMENFLKSQSEDVRAEYIKNIKYCTRCGKCAPIIIEANNKTYNNVCAVSIFDFENPTTEQFRQIKQYIKMRRNYIDLKELQKKEHQCCGTDENDLHKEGLHIGKNEFLLRMEKILAHEGVTTKCDKNYISYFPDTKLKQQPLVLRFITDDSGLIAELKLNYIDCYTEIIEKMPEHIKELFRSVRHCRRNACDQGGQKCGMRRSYTLDEEHYYLCSYKYYFYPDISKPEDAEYYAEIIKAEVNAAKERKKYNTAIYE